ncbi:MAG TPA: hypothetical protein VGW14_06005 [Thermoleophilaceae bacterium]|nr:hypothetical protein [Thermoleophilaceae bacterium]
MRLRHLDAVEAYFAAGPGRLIAGDRVLYATPDALFAWRLSGGGYRRVATLPDLGDALNSFTEGGGFVRVEAIAGDRVVVTGGGGVLSFTPDTEPGHLVRVGPRTGPFDDVAGCGERSGRPAALSGDLLAYVAAPARRPACPVGVAAAVDGPAILVRDLAAGGAVRARVPLPYDGAVDRLALEGDRLAYNLGVRPFDPGRREPATSVRVFDLSGGEVLALPPARQRVWALDQSGGLVAARSTLGPRSRGACPGRLRELRHHLPGDPSGTPLRFTPCGLALAVDDGVLRFTVARPDGRAEVVEHDLEQGGERRLATVAGGLVDSSRTHLLVRDATCTRDDVRVVALGAALPAQPSGPLRCPVAVRARRRVSAGGRFHATVSCRLGCMGRYILAIPHARSDWHSHYAGDLRVRRGGRRVLRFRIARATAKRGRTRGVLTIDVRNPTGANTVVRRLVSVSPAHPAPRFRAPAVG